MRIYIAHGFDLGLTDVAKCLLPLAKIYGYPANMNLSISTRHIRCQFLFSWTEASRFSSSVRAPCQCIPINNNAKRRETLPPAPNTNKEK